MFKIALLGNGSLAKAFQTQTKHDVCVFKKPELDFLSIDSIENNISLLANYDVVINTIGIHQGNPSDIVQINYLSPKYILDKLIELDYQGKVIFIGSHGSTWTSWPGIDTTRLNYNVSKANLKTYMMSLSQSGLAKYQICLFDSTKFVSPMSGFEGSKVEDVANLLEELVDLQNPRLLHIETY